MVPRFGQLAAHPLDEIALRAYVRVDAAAMLMIIGQGSMHPRQIYRRMGRDDLVRGKALHLMPDHDILHADTAPPDPRPAAAGPRGRFDPG